MGYAKQVVNVLTGTAGIATFPAEAAPGNAVSLAEVIRAIHADVTGLNGSAMRGTDSAALASAWTATRAGYVDELGPTNVPADLDLVKAVTDALTAAGAAKQLALLAGAVTGFIAVSGTLSTTQMTTNLTETTDDHYKNRTLIWTTGTLGGQGTEITAYNGTSKMLTFTAVTEAPIAGDSFIIV